MVDIPKVNELGRARAIKGKINLNVDLEIIEWWRAMGPGYQAKINDLLRWYAVQNGFVPKRTSGRS